VYQLPACVADLDLIGDVRKEGINQENIAYILVTGAAGSCGPSISHAGAYVTRTKIQPNGRMYTSAYVELHVMCGTECMIKVIIYSSDLRRAAGFVTLMPSTFALKAMHV
jgi:hypothetical protein